MTSQKLFLEHHRLEFLMELQQIFFKILFKDIMIFKQYILINYGSEHNVLMAIRK